MRSMTALALVLFLAAPAPARAERGTPSWVPLSLGVAVVVAGAAYLFHRHQEKVAGPLTPQESVLELITYIASPQERAELMQLTAPRDVEAYLARFAGARDPSPGTPENEFWSEHVRRFRYANEHLGGRVRGFSTDRGRVYILHGPPERIAVNAVSELELDEARPSWKSVEAWQYATPAGGNRLPPLLGGLYQVLDRGRKFFLFANKTDGATLEQVFSTENGEKIDPSIYVYGGLDLR